MENLDRVLIVTEKISSQMNANKTSYEQEIGRMMAALSLTRQQEVENFLNKMMENMDINESSEVIDKWEKHHARIYQVTIERQIPLKPHNVYFWTVHNAAQCLKDSLKTFKYVRIWESESTISLQDGKWVRHPKVIPWSHYSLPVVTIQADVITIQNKRGDVSTLKITPEIENQLEEKDDLFEYSRDFALGARTFVRDITLNLCKRLVVMAPFYLQRVQSEYYEPSNINVNVLELT
jgi:hypothetical protein